MVRMVQLAGLYLDLAKHCNAEVRRGEKELVSGRTVSVSPAVPAMPGTQARIWRRGLRGLIVVQVALSGVSFPVHAAQPEPECPSLLMDFECAMYRQRLNLSGSASQRGQVIAEYAQIQKERHRACPLSDKATRRAVPLHSAQR